MNNQRILTPYEKNQLLKFGIKPEKLIRTDAPVEYLTGHVDFCGFNFLVDKNVLIPRVETEELVILAIKNAELISKKKLNHKPSSQHKITIIDVGTGSGAIAISVSKKLKKRKIEHEVVALDISKKALDLAQKNLQIIDGNLPVKFNKSNLLSAIINDTSNASSTKIDMIIANLPYIPSNRIENLDKSVKNFEPLIALDGGEDGLYLVRKLLIQAYKIISKNGNVLLELDITHDQKKMTEFKNNWKIKMIESDNGGVFFCQLKKRK